MVFELERSNRVSNASNDLKMRSRENSDLQGKRQENKKRDKEEHLDTYKKSGVVTDSIEEQIRQQKAKIEELTRNLALLEERYETEFDAKNEAIRQRHRKMMENQQAESDERGFKRALQKFIKKLADFDNYSYENEKNYMLADKNYQASVLKTKSTKTSYETAKENAMLALSKYHSADLDYSVGLWNKRDEMWDLIRLQRGLLFLTA